MAINKLRYNMDGLEKIQKTLEEAKKFRAQVGIFGNENQRDSGSSSLTNAEIAARHEFGFTIEDGPFKGIRVVPRSILRMPIGTHIKDIQALIKNDVMPLLAAGKIPELFKRLGIACEKIIDQAFQTSGWGFWKPNTPVTVMLKGSDKPLIDSTQLRHSITSRVDKK